MQLQDYLTPSTVNAMLNKVARKERLKNGTFTDTDLSQQKTLWLQSVNNSDFQLMLISVGYDPQVAESIAAQYPDNN